MTIKSNSKYIPSAFRKLYVVMLLMTITVAVAAQGVSVRATVNPSEIQIGQQALIDLQVISPKNKNIQFPVYEKEIVPGVEVLTMLKPDTLIQNDVMTIHFKYVVTSFDSTLYNIPRIPVFDGKDTVYSNSFGLKVTSPILKDSTIAYLQKMQNKQTDSINFDELRLNDIKKIQKVPFVWTDYLWILWIIAGVLLLLLLIGLIIYFILKKKRQGYLFTPPVVKTPYEIAVEGLNKIKEEKIWRQGREKEYYTQLTDILREYLHERYGINAMGMISGELLDELKNHSDSNLVFNHLKEIFTTSDLVKFAKHKPFTDENDTHLKYAYEVVEEIKEKNQEENKSSTNSSKTE